MDNKNVDLRVLAEKIYDLDTEVYECLGSSLGRVFTGDKEKTVRELMRELHTRSDGHVIRSDMALISNMARTIRDKEVKHRIMIKYDEIFQEVISLPTSFADGDVMLKERIALNTASRLSTRFSDNDHTVICIGRTFGSGGSEIGFRLADHLKMNYYDAEIFNEVLRRIDAEKDHQENPDKFPDIDDYENKERYVKSKPAFATHHKATLMERIKEFGRYHGLPKKDAVYFNQSQLICEKAKQEDFVIMGRCADVILANNHIPHISIFITAPIEQRIQRVMQINENLTRKQAEKLIKRMDRKHVKYFKYYTGLEWGSAKNYDICINSACYGLEGTMNLILQMINEHV